MERIENLTHWEDWAADFGTSLRATTKCLSIKRLEIEALLRQIRARLTDPDPLVVEVGCGNGVNGFALASAHQSLRYIGFDFAPTMISSAIEALGQGERGAMADRLAFAVADGRELGRPIRPDETRPNFVGQTIRASLPADYADLVFTDRMLINLSSPGEQLKIMRRIADILRPGGLFLMIENSVQTFQCLNKVRSILGLPAREAARFNVFIDEPSVIDPFKESMNLLEVDDFSSIHDLMLYAIEPAVSNGEVQYDSPLMMRLTDAVLSLREMGLGADGFGQNRLWVWKK